MNSLNNRKIGVTLVVIGIVIYSLLVFRAGVSVGFHKAGFAGAFGRNLEANLIGPGPRMMGLAGLGDGRSAMYIRRTFDERLPGGHGAVGEVVDTDLPRIVIESPDNLERTILIGSTTKVRKLQQQARPEDIRVNDFIIVLGNPDDAGQIAAKLVRIMPAPGLRMGARATVSGDSIYFEQGAKEQ